MDAREPTRTSKLAAQPTPADAQPTRRAAMRLSPASLAAAASPSSLPARRARCGLLIRLPGGRQRLKQPHTHAEDGPAAGGVFIHTETLLLIS